MSNASSPEATKRFYTAVPLALTSIRVILAPLILVWAWNGRAGLPYVLCLIVAFVTDYFDGVVARRLGVATAAVRRYDSAADVVFYVAAFVAVWLVHPEVVRQHWVGLALVAGLEAIRVTTDTIKFRREASYHMWSAKLWNITLFVALTGLMGFGISGWLFQLPIVVGIVTNLEGLAASLLLPTWTHDVPTVYHAYRSPGQGRIGLPQKVPGIDAGEVAIAPHELQGIRANGIQLFNGDAGVGGVAHQGGVGRTAHVGVAAFALDAGAGGAQPGEGIAADTAVFPANR